MGLEEAVQAASEVQGWMQVDELRWLGERASEHRLIVEVGSWHGRSTKVMAMMTTGKVVSIDNLAFDDAGFGDGQADEYFDQWLSGELKSGKVEKVRRSSLDVARRFRRTPDMIFVDGSHEQGDVLADLEAWGRHLKDGGLFCGHDCTIPDVQVALGQYVEDHGVDWSRAGPGSLWTIP